MGNWLWRGHQNKGGHELKEVVRKAILHLDEKNVFWCNQFSRMHANVWLVRVYVSRSCDLSIHHPQRAPQSLTYLRSARWRWQRPRTLSSAYS